MSFIDTIKEMGSIAIITIVFGVFLSQKVANKPLTIIGSGNQTRDFIHVKDLANVIIKSAFSKKLVIFTMLDRE